MSKRHLYILVILLSSVGLATFAYKVVELGFPMVPDKLSELWQVDVRVGFTANGRPVKVAVHVPQSTPISTVLDQTFISPGYGVAVAPRGDNRLATFTTRKADGEQAVYYRTLISQVKAPQSPIKAPIPPVPKPTLEGIDLAAAKAIAARITHNSADESSFVTLLLQQLRAPQKHDETGMLLKDRTGPERMARVAVNVLALAKIASRSVHGITLDSDHRNLPLTHWLEVYLNGAWQPYDLKTGNDAAPERAVPWWRGRSPFVNVEGADKSETVVAASRTYRAALATSVTQGREAKSVLVEFSIFSLPIQTRAVYQVLLAVPIAIMLLVMLRNLVGIKTFGTFMPVLIAMAFRETQLLWGIILFTAVCGVGLSVRFYLERLKLLLVPRLAAVVIVVIAIMVVLSIVSHKLGFERGLSVALFPIVILAMTIERMSIIWDERGPKESLHQAGGSLATAILCYLVMTLDIVQHLFFVFPELLLVVLAVTLMLGRYSGYRLVELPRFKVLAGDK